MYSIEFLPSQQEGDEVHCSVVGCDIRCKLICSIQSDCGSCFGFFLFCFVLLQGKAEKASNSRKDGKEAKDW